MTDLIFPRGITIARNRFRYVDSTGVSRNPYTGTARTASRGGDRVGCSMDTAPAGGGSANSQRERAQLLAFIVSMRGKQNRAYLWDHSYRIRGSFPASELLSNNTFASGTTGWSTGSEYSVSVQDQVARCVRTAVTISQPVLTPSAAPTVTQYAVYAARAMLVHGRGSFGNVGLYFGSTSAGTDYGPGASYDTDFGLYTVAGAAIATTAYPTPVDLASSGLVAGDYMSIPYISLSRCALADAQPNMMTYSDQFDNAAWTKTRASITANATSAPDGTTTADALVEDSSASTTHLMNPATQPTRTSAAEDLCVTVCAKRGSGTRDVQLRVGSDSSNFAHCIFDLGAGSAGSVTNAGTATAGRASITSLGNGWYRCSLVARVAASTTAYSVLNMVNGGTNTYTGNGTSSIYLWRYGIARSGVAFLPMQTTSAGDSDGTPYTMFANGMNLKGLPASTAGLLLPGDWFEVITSYGSELKMCTASLNSDASGCGYLQFSPPLRGSASNDAAVIFQQPMGRFVFAGDVMEWMTDPGIVSAASFEWEEAVG